MKEIIKKRDVLPVLRMMKVGDKEAFPVEQDGSVRTSIGRAKIEMLRYGANWKRSINEENFTIIVERVS